jgi:hypothetical protein
LKNPFKVLFFASLAKGSNSVLVAVTHEPCSTRDVRNLLLRPVGPNHYHRISTLAHFPKANDLFINPPLIEILYEGDDLSE